MGKIKMIRIGIVGATGYTGAELLRLLSFHSEVEVVVITSNAKKGESITSVFPSLKQYNLKFTGHDSEELYSCDLVFFATPNAVAMNYVPSLLENNCRVIDLSADFRIQCVKTWQKWYKEKHACPQLLESAVYGLPEVNRESIKESNLIANPGCYPTAVLLALLPAVTHGLIEMESIIANAVSGISGAGRNAVLSDDFSDFSDSFKAYGVFKHRHLPEITQTLKKYKKEIDIIFTPHLVSMHRGIHATLYLDPVVSPKQIKECYKDFYSNEKFVNILPNGSYPETRAVKMKNMCNIALHFNTEKPQRLIILSVIDNLVKGAAGQAIQNMNIMYDFAEETGLLSTGKYT